MSNHANRSGYDWNVNQAKCPHEWCREDFHGLAITQRMWHMRRFGGVDPEYRYAEDDSPVLCPGSLYEGEFEPPHTTESAVAEEIAFLQRLAGIPRLPMPNWTVDVGSSRTSRPGNEPLRDVIVASSTREANRYARRRNLRNAIIVTEDQHARGLILDRHRLHMLDPDAELLRDLGGRTRYGQPLESFYDATYPGVLTEEEKRRLRDLYVGCAAPYPVEAMSDTEREHIERSLVDRFMDEVEDMFWAGVIHRDDIRIHLDRGENRTYQARFAQFTARWEPRQRPIPVRPTLHDQEQAA